MSSKKSKSRKGKQYQGQGRGISETAAATLLGEWTQLNKTRDAVSQMIDHHLSLTQWACQQGVFHIVEQHGDLALLQQRLNTFGNDLDMVQRKFNSIKATHDGQFGKAKTPDDMINCIDINGNYSDLADAMAQLLVPMSATITEQINAANTARLLVPPPAAPQTENQSKTETPK